jgi:hypothetical protein
MQAHLAAAERNAHILESEDHDGAPKAASSRKEHAVLQR